MQSSLGAVGHQAGWDLELVAVVGGAERKLLARGSRDYRAEIDASLPGGLEPGSYSVAIEGITDEDYGVVHAAWNERQRIYARLYLFWHDTPSLAGAAASLGGDALSLARQPDPDTLVAVLRVTRFSRRMGARRYEAVLEGHERVYDQALARLAQPAQGTTCLQAATRAAEQLGVAVQATPLPGTRDVPGAETWIVPEGELGLAALQRLAQRMEQMDQRYGRGMMLIRDGKLHLGPGRRIPLSGKGYALDVASGLVQVETTGARTTDPQQAAQAGKPESPPLRNTYQLLLKGRPELKPGDVVRVSAPGAPAAGIGGALGGGLAQGLGAALGGAAGEIAIYVTGVRHRLSRTTGFSTTVAGVDLLGPGQEWDQPTAASRPALHPGDPSASPHERVASAIRALSQRREHEPLAVAEVRASHVAGAAEPPSQTVSVRRGLAPSDGRPRQARRLPMTQEARAVLAGVPYVTPFAWGKCGLVLPRYPGTRVLLGHHLGHEDDPVDLGALWESGHGPDAQAGDWWLILPADVSPSQRQSLPVEQAPEEPTGLATNDLIDADGNRVIEVGKLTVRIGTNLLQTAGTRPQPPADEEEVTIEHQSGSRIVIKQNGDIVIHSEGELQLSAKTRLTLEADDVAVKVTNVMDVGDR